MAITSLQVCMDSWMQGGAVSDENTGSLMDSSPIIASPTGDHDQEILTCSRPLIERRLRPQHEQALKCPRCESTHTKFCYYNNYSLSQPRYFCKTCRRYWTKGGTIRNIPVGGGCRKNKKVSKKPSSSSSTSSAPDQIHLHRPSPSSLLSSPDLILGHNHNKSSTTSHETTDLQLAFPDQLQFSSIHGGPGLFNPANAGFLFDDIITPNTIEYMGNTNKYDGFMGSNNHGGMNNMAMQNPSNVFHGNNNICSNNYHLFGNLSSFEHGIDNPAGGGGANILESCQRLMLPYDENHHHHHHDHVDVKPNAKILSLEWHDCNSDAGIKDSFGYNLGGLGSWTGLMNGYGSSATNPLV